MHQQIQITDEFASDDDIDRESEPAPNEAI